MRKNGRIIPRRLSVHKSLHQPSPLPVGKLPIDFDAQPAGADLSQNSIFAIISILSAMHKQDYQDESSKTIATSHVAVLIDFDNIWIGLHGTGIKASARAIAIALHGYAEQLGTVAVARVYASEPHRTSSMRESFIGQGYEVVLAERSKAIDISMALDGQALLFSHPEINTYVLVSGDSDIAPLTQAFRKMNKTLVVVAPTAVASKILVEQADLFLSSGRLFGPSTTSLNPKTEERAPE